MMRILPAVALVGLCQWPCLLAYVHSTSAAQQINTDKENSNTFNKSLEFVNIIKDDLRRNNDDYEPLEGENHLSDTAPLAHPAKSSHSVHPVRPGHPTPRQPYRNIISPTRSARPPRRPPAQPVPSPARAAPMRRFNTWKAEADRKQPAPIHPDQFRSYTRSKHYKSLRLDKLKQLNKDYINMRQEELVEDVPQAEDQPETEDTTTASPPATEPTTQSSPPPTTPEHKPPPSPLTHKPPPSPLTHAPTPLQDRKEQGLMMRSRKDTSPSPEQLDMAPARNPEITRIRIKGRLCQRSLMNAEGPTYDKQGKLLERAYWPTSENGRKFHQTRRPRLLLPRCCNCCKKSVLGCQ